MSFVHSWRPPDWFVEEASAAKIINDKETNAALTGIVLAGLQRILRCEAQLRQWPHLTNGCVAFVLTGIADLLVQALEIAAGERSNGCNVKETWALAATSSIYMGLVFTSWVFLLDWSLPQKHVYSALGKLAATSFFLQPCIYIPYFFFVHGWLLGQTLDEISGHVAHDYLDLLVRLWSLLMPTRLLMFWVLPVEYQVVWDCSISFLWQIALALFEERHTGHVNRQHAKAMG